MKIWTSEHTFEHNWETVVKAAWKKYPNPMNPAVVGIDVLDRYVDKKGVLKSHRLMTTRWGLPEWAKKLLGASEHAYGSEHSEVDTKGRTMTLISKNLTFCNIVTIDEKLVYSPHPADSSKTQLKQEAVVTIHGIPLSSYLEKIITQNINNNAHKGRQGMEWVIEKVKSEAETLQTEAANLTKETFHNMESILNRNTSF